MTITISTDHANELILVDDVLDPGGRAVVTLGLINQDGSDTFPGRTLTPDQAEELAASLAQAAAATSADRRGDLHGRPEPFAERSRVGVGHRPELLLAGVLKANRVVALVVQRPYRWHR